MSEHAREILLLDMFGVIITEGHLITNGTTRLFPDVSVAEQRRAYHDYEQDKIDGAEFWRRIGSPVTIAESERALFDRFELDSAFFELADCVRERMDIAVLSNMPKDWKPLLLEFGIGSRLRHFFVSGEVRLWKPGREFFEWACAQMGVAPRQCTFVDDQRVNLATAAELGMRTVWVDRPGQSGYPSDYLPDHRVSELAELKQLLALPVSTQ